MNLFSFGIKLTANRPKGEIYSQRNITSTAVQAVKYTLINIKLTFL
jgi:hypothetical protein